MIKSWSTADVPPRDREAYWVDAVCDTFVHLDCEPRRDRPFHGEIRSDVAGNMCVGTVVSTAQLVTRSQRQISRDPADIFLINVQLSGHGMVSQDGRDATLRPGDFALYDSTRPYRLTFDGDFAQAVLQIPRALLVRRIGASENFTATRIDGTMGIGGVLSPMLRALPSQLGAIPVTGRQRIADCALDLVVAALLSSGGERAPLTTRMSLARAKLWIEQHLAEKLSAERIAQGCNLSVRHLSRLFTREGTALMEYVWARRLARCHLDLTDPAMQHRSITEIALAAGFNDLSHFSRSYRAHYGLSPREVRAQRLAAL
jgi:AraC-like DNA-binding protein